MIQLTGEAAKKVQALSEQEQGAVALRIGVRPGGCSGFSYEMFFDATKDENDITQEVDGVVVVMDPMSASMLDGATLSYKDTLQQSGFTIDNPNAQRTCGCGNSFS